MSPARLRNVFYRPPEDFSLHDSELLPYALGALLYCPATAEDIAQRLTEKRLAPVKSLVLCLEDSIGDGQVEAAEINLRAQLRIVSGRCGKDPCALEELPLLFVRVRTPEQLERILQWDGELLRLLTGFVFPKLGPDNCRDYFSQLENHSAGLRFYGMPIIETPAFLSLDTRRPHLSQLRRQLDAFRSCVLNVRIGGTDLSGLLGIRRTPRHPLHRISALSDLMGDIVTTFSLGKNPYVVSACVWEYYSGVGWLEGLAEEVSLDIANGLWGKTVIHPDQVLPVQALHIVGREDFDDALLLTRSDAGCTGAFAGSRNNKMNESRPHRRWARETLLKARIYGVHHYGMDYRHLRELLR